MKIFLILLLSVFLYAGHSEKKEHHLNKDLSHLDLTSSQKESVKKLLKDFREQLKDFREEKEAIEYRKKELFKSDNLSASSLEVLNKSIFQKANAIESEMLIKMHSLLTKEQRVRFARYLDEWEVE
ncbi:MAG: hypothetical protein PHW07_07865 [Sulfurospirillaceae bacterium]|nr:hypothetical protein [Sulfurospirillaceae bacterium]